jgi:peptidoglycan/LPS O-acetylase OafA/YrhL
MWILIVGAFTYYRQGFFAAEPRFAGSILLYFLPGLVMIFLARRMTKTAIWPYPLATILSFVNFALCVAIILYAHTVRKPFLGDSIVCEGIGRLPNIVLFIACLNTLPDIRAVMVTRRRRRMHALQGTQIQAPVAVPPPPASALRMLRK